VNSKPTSSSGFLAAGGVAAVLASSCCLGPLILVMMGFSGAWIGSLSALEPYRPLFLGFTLIALLLAGFRIFVRLNAISYWSADFKLNLQRYSVLDL
jgi:mercuric ion transport protein